MDYWSDKTLLLEWKIMQIYPIVLLWTPLIYMGGEGGGWEVEIFEKS